MTKRFLIIFTALFIVMVMVIGCGQAGEEFYEIHNENIEAHNEHIIDIRPTPVGLSFYSLEEFLYAHRAVSFYFLPKEYMASEDIMRSAISDTRFFLLISSIWGVSGASCEAVYSAAKAGVIGFTKSIAKELGPCGIRVNVIACGAFETRMNEHLSVNEKEMFSDNIPLGRFWQAHEVGTLAVFLASNEASYITGQVINLDGGFV